MRLLELNEGNPKINEQGVKADARENARKEEDNQNGAIAALFWPFTRPDAYRPVILQCQY